MFRFVLHGSKIKAVILISLLLIDASGNTGNQRVGQKYPNELKGFKMFEDALWNTIQPLESASEDISRVLGGSYLDYNWNGMAWHMAISYVGEKSTCNDIPWPDSLKGKVYDIAVIPKSRIDFSKKIFPKTFKKSSVYSSHAIVQWDEYKDDYGLSYEVYNGNSPDGKIKAGDLRAITYGPSTKFFKEKTGCD